MLLYPSIGFQPELLSALPMGKYHRTGTSSPLCEGWVAGGLSCQLLHLLGQFGFLSLSCCSILFSSFFLFEPAFQKLLPNQMQSYQELQSSALEILNVSLTILPPLSSAYSLRCHQPHIHTQKRPKICSSAPKAAFIPDQHRHIPVPGDKNMVFLWRHQSFLQPSAVSHRQQRMQCSPSAVPTGTKVLIKHCLCSLCCCTGLG